MGELLWPAVALFLTVRAASFSLAQGFGLDHFDAPRIGVNLPSRCWPQYQISAPSRL
jgi:hypothetical protein